MTECGLSTSTMVSPVFPQESFSLIISNTTGISAAGYCCCSTLRTAAAALPALLGVCRLAVAESRPLIGRWNPARLPRWSVHEHECQMRTGGQPRDSSSHK